MTKRKPKPASRKALAAVSSADPKPSKTGRRHGSHNFHRIESTVILSRCPKCGSTNRERYGSAPIVLKCHGGKEPHTGNPVSHQILRRTKCLDCGQHRRDVAYAFDPEASIQQIQEAATVVDRSADPTS
jgi:transposase